MPLREGRWPDRNVIASVCSAAFFDEDLFGRLMHPYRHEYPEDVVLFWQQFILDHWFDWANRVLVATSRESEHGEEKIVGMAIWQRQGEGSKKMIPGTLDPRNLAQPLIQLTGHLTSILRPNRALDPTKVDILPESFPFSAHHWAGNRSECWYLSLLAVLPDYQGQGYGRELVKWGLQRAEEENVHASVMASEGNDDFYLRCGFDEIVGNACEGEGNPLNGVKGGNILFKWPRK